jgi:hypothetical protein
MPSHLALSLSLASEVAETEADKGIFDALSDVAKDTRGWHWLEPMRAQEMIIISS